MAERITSPAPEWYVPVIHGSVQHQIYAARRRDDAACVVRHRICGKGQSTGPGSNLSTTVVQIGRHPQCISAGAIECATVRQRTGRLHNQIARSRGQCAAISQIMRLDRQPLPFCLQASAVVDSPVCRDRSRSRSANRSRICQAGCRNCQIASINVSDLPRVAQTAPTCCQAQ